MPYKQNITHYLRRHRLASIITGHILVMSICMVALFGNSLSKSLTSVFAGASCPTGDQAYTVKSGETLSGIAMNYRTTWQALAQQNKIANPQIIYPGQTICLPEIYKTSGQDKTTSPQFSTVAANSNASSVSAIINEVFGAHAPAAQRVAMCESGLNPNAVNGISIGGSHAKGLFQILHPSTWNTTSQAGNSPFDARANTIAAHEIFVRDGHSWRQWACKP